ncbi:hypothetical protein HA402_010779 [Bradysia odoriphaga]|nr:hypothetical protein HA402_010779 [Bradysia odoriphaga]
MGYEIDRSLWWNRPIWDLTNNTESRIRAAIARDSAYPGNRSVSVAHRSDGCDYYYNRAENAGPLRNETVTEEHWRITDDSKVPYWLRNKLSDSYWWSLRTPSLVRAQQLAIKPW